MLSALCESLIPDFVNTRAFWPQTPPELATLWIERLLKILSEQEAMPACKKHKANSTQATAVFFPPIRDHVVSDFMALVTRLELQLSPLPADHCPPPLRFVFVCRHDVAPTVLGLLDYIPHLTARVNASGGNIRLITLPKGSRKELYKPLSITSPHQLSGSIIAIEDNDADMSLLTAIPDSFSRWP
ncbi:hypothetical protein BDZ89DRAFT_125344 [Hymenopellis radicata]|nr:hypothetical protein BDZ89DRAFT_125344 [Hymenopellis radicata]